MDDELDESCLSTPPSTSTWKCHVSYPFLTVWSFCSSWNVLNLCFNLDLHLSTGSVKFALLNLTSRLFFSFWININKWNWKLKHLLQFVVVIKVRKKKYKEIALIERHVVTSCLCRQVKCCVIFTETKGIISNLLWCRVNNYSVVNTNTYTHTDTMFTCGACEDVSSVKWNVHLHHGNRIKPLLSTTSTKIHKTRKKTLYNITNS